MRANKVNNKLNDNLLLTKSDSSFIASNLEVDKDYINQFKRGDRGKRKRRTPIQDAVKKALDKRSKQNEELVQFCMELKVKLVIPQ